MSAAQGRDRPTPCAGERHTERTVSWGNRVNYKRNLLSLALASATMMLAAQVHAQAQQPPPADQDDQDEEEVSATELDRVVVTGIRAAIEESIDTKRESNSIVEAISAEDIGKLPDTSIADSIARLPGLTAQRFGGRPQEINIRGFAGDFSTALLNGREQVSLGNNRGVEFDQYPSELINRVVVYKTPDAALVGQGLSGTVDLQTVRPLEYGERTIAVNLRGDMNELHDEKEYGNRFSISYIDQFADNTIGLALGYARLNNPGQAYRFESWGYPNGAIGGGQLYDFESDNQRDGFMGVLEFRPNDMYRTSLDLFYSEFKREEIKRGMEFGFEWGAAGPPVSRVDNSQGTAVEATFTNFKPIIRNDFNASYDDLFAIGWNNEFRFGQDWKVTADVSHSSAKRDERILETYAVFRDGLSDTVNVRLNPAGYFDFDFGMDYGNPDNFVLMDPGGWGGDRAQAGYLKDFRVEDELTALRLDFERSFLDSPISRLRFGGNVTDRTKSRSSTENTLCTTAGCTDNSPVGIPSQFVTGNTEFGFAGLNSLFSLDARGMVDNFYFLLSKDHPDISNKNWEVEETVSTGYVQVDIDTEILSIPVRGNLGVQAVNVDQSSTGVATFEGVALSEPATRGASYTHYLPSLNLVFELPAEQIVRFGAARQMARPRMDEMRANAGYGINRTGFCSPSTPPPCWSGGGGNPELEPWLAKAYDLSYEKYFAQRRGYISLAYFHKELESYIYSQSTPFDFSQLPIPTAIAPEDQPASSIGIFTQPANGKGGVVRGHEIAVSLPLDLLWSPLEGFGIVANYSDTDSSIQPLGPDFPNEPLPGLSKYVSNVTVYYERYGFSARVAQRHRSAFLGEVQGFGGDRTRRVFEGETVTDVQLGYSFPADGALQGLSLLLQVNNLENEPFRSTFDGRDDRPREYFEFGRTYLFGVNYRF
jgi:iron complex outermembrane recepter protein